MTDVVVHAGPWEPDPDSRYETVDMVPWEGSLLTGITYREIRTERFRRSRRRITEFLTEPARLVPVLVSERPVDDSSHEMTFTAEYRPAVTTGRWFWEYRNAD